MKTFKEYLSESAKKYDFRIKVAGEFSKEQAKTLESLLQKFNVSGFKNTGKTPIQELPLDFPKIKNAEVNIFEVTLDYPSTQWELEEYICTGMGLHKEAVVVRKPNEPYEEYQAAKDAAKKDALLNDSEYKEATNVNFDEYYGDKYNTKFVKELNDVLKSQRKERGEKIPMETVAKFNTDNEINSQSVLKQSKDPRKK